MSFTIYNRLQAFFKIIQIKMYFIFCNQKNNFTFAPGEMAEWSNAAVLKTVDLHGSGGSNPSLSAELVWSLEHEQQFYDFKLFLLLQRCTLKHKGTQREIFMFLYLNSRFYFTISLIVFTGPEGSNRNRPKPVELTIHAQA